MGSIISSVKIILDIRRKIMKKVFNKKIVAYLLTAVAAFSLLTGCGKATETATTQSEAEDTKSKFGKIDI